jgi:polyhydroxyalkanoate synthesis regulator phasin
MAEPENQTLHILRELREALKSLDIKVDRGFGEMKSRMDNIRQALNGESVLGRYAAAEVEDRLEAIEKRLDDLEKT